MNKSASFKIFEMTTCAICLDSLQAETGSPNVCDHIFCLKCIIKWSKYRSYCPICRKRFKKIIDLVSETSIQIKCHKRKNSQSLYDVSSNCEICETPDKADTLLLCDSCDLGFHCECLTPPLESVPSGQWFCPPCVLVERKLRSSQGDQKALKSVSRDKETIKNSSKPGPSRRFSRSLQSSASTSTSSVSDDLTCDSKVPSKEKLSNSLQDTKNTDDFNSKKNCSDNNVPSNKTQREEIIIVSNDDYKILNCLEKDLYLSSGIRIFSKSFRSQSNSSASKPFNVFRESDNVSTSKSQYFTRPSHLKERPSKLHKRSGKYHKWNGINASESQETLEQCNVVSPPRNKPQFNDSDYSEASCGVSYMQSSSEDCSISSKLSETEGCDLKQQLDQLYLSTAVLDRKTNSVNNIVNESETKTSESSLLLTIPMKSSSNNSEPNSVHNLTEPSECRRPYQESSLLLNKMEVAASDKQLAQKSEEYSKVSSKYKMAKLSHPGLVELKCDESNSQSNAIQVSNHPSDQPEINFNDSVLLDNPLMDFEARNAQYTLRAKASLHKELQKMEQEKWKSWNPKRSRHQSFTQMCGDHLLDFPKRKMLSVNRTANSDHADSRPNVFNVDEYKEKMRNGTWKPENIVIVERHKSSHSHRLQNHVKEEKGSNSFNVFQVPDSKSDFEPNDKSRVYIASFNPSQNQTNIKDSKICNMFQRSILQAALHVNLEELSARQDGSLYLNWSKCS